MNALKFITTSVVACLLGMSPALADRLDDIKANGKLVCGTVPNFEPFSFPDPTTRELVGYDVDFCNTIAAKLGVTAEIKTLSLEARIPELTEGRVDMLVAVLGYTPARAEQIDFSYGYYVSPSVIAVRADRGYNDLESLAGKRIAVIKSSNTEIFTRKSIPNVNIVAFDDAPTGFLALVQNKVDGFGTSSVAIGRLIDKSKGSVDLKVIEQPVGTETWGIGIKKGEDRLLDAVNDALLDMENSGEAGKIFDKWLGDSTIYKLKKQFKIEKITANP
ncbi:ABC transporter substrate-binding protein [Brucella tritici]|uniref:ABC transporter substrate-binding protein n=1 Tax=Brucella tritici TaxID=94626 RepID=UPI00124D52D5|nr:ABC transporter substrate-binding protein [Brucella tritici]KAB2679629.1 ABC transporter substrate-binding protein [Brucella tritici]